MPPGFQPDDAGQAGFQYLEDLACAHWYSQVLFTALELDLFGFLDKKPVFAPDLAGMMGARPQALIRLLRALEQMSLIKRVGEKWHNTQVSACFLVPGKPDFMGGFLLYRQYMRPRWDDLTCRVCPEQKTGRDTAGPPDDYETRNLNYVRSTDALVRQKAGEIAALVCPEMSGQSLLDLGGGAGSLIRAMQKARPGIRAWLFDLPEVIRAGQALYPGKEAWERITPVAGDFRTHGFDRAFSLVVMSNFLHVYSPEEAREILNQALCLVAPEGLAVIHDYFPDRAGSTPQKGALYDLAMMLNTYNGVCHTCEDLTAWLREAGFARMAAHDLSTDSGLIIAKR